MRNTISKFAFAAALGFALAFTFSCSGGDDPPNGGDDPPNGGNTPPKVVYGAPLIYEGETYETVIIGTQTWMARNFNYNAPGSKCYDNSENYCAIYGRLYDWETARVVCPTRWHLPSDAEWETLIEFVGGSQVAGNKLKAIDGWNWSSYAGQSGGGTDEFGFSALPGGCGISDDIFGAAGQGGIWWSATEIAASYAYYRDMSSGSTGVYRSNYVKANLLSVRCVQN